MKAKASIGAMAATLVMLSLVTALYAPSARRAGDLGLARVALESLAFVGQAGAVHGAASIDFSNALEDNFATIDLFLHSDSRDRLGDVGAAVDESWLAYLVADQLWRLQEDGTDQPMVSQVYASERLLRGLPEMRVSVIGEGAEARFDDKDLKAVKALLELARSRRVKAATVLKAAESRP